VTPARIVLLPLVALLAASAAHAVEPGDRVRVTILAREAAPDSLFARAGVEPREKYAGSLLFADSLGIELRDEDGQAREIPQEIVALFEESAGRKSSAGRGALLGFLIGGVGGVAFGIYFEESEGVSNNERGLYPVGFGLGGALVGCGVGALVGAMIKRERWSPVGTIEGGPR